MTPAEALAFVCAHGLAMRARTGVGVWHGSCAFAGRGHCRRTDPRKLVGTRARSRDICGHPRDSE
jgi:hypothetical protein